MMKAGKWLNSFITSLARLAALVVKIVVAIISVATLTVGATVIAAGITNNLPSLIATLIKLQ
jgi:hypothetical protein